MISFRRSILAAALAATLALTFAPIVGVAQNNAPTIANAAKLPPPTAVTTAVAPAADVQADNAVVVQDANAITIPVANWIDQIAVVIRDIGVAALPAIGALILAMLPAPIRIFAGPMLQKQMNGILEKALDYGINAVKGATHDKPLTIDVGNAVLAHALQYVIDHAPGWLVKTAGGEAGLRQKIFARLNLPVNASIEQFDVDSVAPTKATRFRLPKGK